MKLRLTYDTAKSLRHGNLYRWGHALLTFALCFCAIGFTISTLIPDIGAIADYQMLIELGVIFVITMFLGFVKVKH